MRALLDDIVFHHNREIGG